MEQTIKTFIASAIKPRATMHPAAFIQEWEAFLNQHRWARPVLTSALAPEDQLSKLVEHAIKSQIIKADAPTSERRKIGASPSAPKERKERKPEFDLSRPCVRIFNGKGEHLAVNAEGKKLGGNYERVSQADGAAIRALVNGFDDWYAIVSFSAKGKDGNPKVYESRINREAACEAAWTPRHHGDASKRMGVSPRNAMNNFMSVHNDTCKFSRG